MQTPAASWANKLLQTGRSDVETKTAGCHGGLSSPGMNCPLLGNAHPHIIIEMLRGLRGDHGCQLKARLAFVTGRPIQPHEHCASCGRVEAKTRWCEVPQELMEVLDMEWACARSSAADHFGELKMTRDRCN